MSSPKEKGEEGVIFHTGQVKPETPLFLKMHLTFVKMKTKGRPDTWSRE